MVKLVGPLLGPAESRPRPDMRLLLGWGAVILVLVLVDQFLLGRFR